MHHNDNEENSKESYTEECPLKETVVEEVNEKINNAKSKRCSQIIKNISVEPTLLLFVITAVIYTITTQNLQLQKACLLSLNLTKEICSSLKLQTVNVQNEFERDAQKVVTDAFVWKTIISSTLSTLLAMFIGSWSDRTGKSKIFLIIVVIGQLLICINGAVYNLFFYDISLKMFTFTEGIIEGSSGHFCVISSIAFSYISNVTTDETRTFRMGCVILCYSAGFPTGMAISGVILKKCGYNGGYGIAGIITSVNLLYSVFILKDSHKSEEQKKHDGKGFCHFFRLFFDLTNIKETLKVVFKNGPNNRRVTIIVMLVVVAILFGPMHGELSILYMSTRYRFNWDEVKFSIFQTYNFITHTIGTIFSITVFSRYLQWHDSILGIISTVSKIAASFVYCFAPNERIFFIAPIVDILNGTSLLAMRSLVSKLVSPDEFGKVNSIFALTENLMPLVYIPLYTRVYVATMEVLPGAVFLMGSAMTIPAVIAFIWILVDHRMQLRKTRIQQMDKEM